MDDFSLSRFSAKDQAYFQSITSGKSMPAIHSDIIAENVLNPDVAYRAISANPSEEDVNAVIAEYEKNPENITLYGSLLKQNCSHLQNDKR